MHKLSEVIILTKEPGTYDSKALVRAIKQAGHEATLIDYTSASASSTLATSSARAVIPRHTPRYLDKVVSLVAQAEQQGIFSIAPATAIQLVNDKYKTYQGLTTAGLDTPKTIALSVDDPDAALRLQKEFGSVCVIKPSAGSQGQGVELVSTKKPLDVSAYTMSTDKFIAQEYIQESHGQDLRVFVVGDKPVAAMLRSSRDSGLRSNLHLGGEAIQTHLSELESRMAVSAAQAFDLKVAGVDILRSRRGPLVLEVNSSPGLMGIEKFTGLDVAGEIVKLISRSID